MNLFEQIVDLLTEEFNLRMGEARSILRENMSDMDRVLFALEIDTLAYASGRLIISDGHRDQLEKTIKEFRDGI